MRRTMPPHLFRPDPDVPPDPLDKQQRGFCATCHRQGLPGDAHHTMPAPQLDVQQLAAGENGGEE